MDLMFNNISEVEELCGDPSLCEVQSGEGNVGLAFGLTIGAGLATTIGAMLPFIPFIKRANTIFLSAGLALAAGVMLYVSFTEILTKSQDNFCCVTTGHYGLAFTACFFGGIIFTVLLDLMVAGLQKLECGCKIPFWSNIRQRFNLVRFRRRRRGIPKLFLRSRHNPDSVHATNMVQMQENGVQNTSPELPILNSAEEAANSGETEFLPNGVDGSLSHRADQLAQGVAFDHQVSECDSQVCGGSSGLDATSISIASGNPSEGTNRGANASVNELFSNTSLLRMNAIIPETASLSLAGVEEDYTGEVESKEAVSVVAIENGNANVNVEGEIQGDEPESEALGPPEFKEVTDGLEKDTKKLHRMGLLTALAIGLHNFPEGMATFVAALSSPSLGVALAIAIALHNIPEGLCVAMPVYYATGSRVKGFLWAFLSGVSEPIGALLGWLVLKDLFGPLVFGITFGLIAGMMVFISLKELLPIAYKFDKTRGKLVAVFLGLGMLIMALSLVLFLY